VKDKDVHHNNGIPWDNRPENIEPIPKEEHAKLHTENKDYSFLEEMNRDENGRLLNK